MNNIDGNTLRSGQAFNVFKSEKARAAVSRILELNGGTADFYYINKMMYLLERKSLIEKGRPFVYDKLFSIKYGPIVSKVYDELKICSVSDSVGWGLSFGREGHNIILKEPGDYDQLSSYDERAIAQTVQQIEQELHLKTLDPNSAFQTLHKYIQKLPEYEAVEKGHRDISYEKILKKTGLSEPEIEEILNSNNDYGVLLRAACI